MPHQRTNLNFQHPVLGIRRFGARSAYDASVRLCPVIAGLAVVVLAACGSGGGSGTRPTITVTPPSDASIVSPTLPPETEAGTPSETQPEAPPETAPPAQTAEPEEQPEPTAAPGTAPSTSVAPADVGDDTVWWPWVLGTLVVVGAIVAIVAITRRRSSGPPWEIRAATLLDEIEQLTSHLVAVTPDGLGAVAQADAMRVATLRATLRDLITTAPDANIQMALNGLTTPISALHGALDAIAMFAGRRPSRMAPRYRCSQLSSTLCRRWCAPTLPSTTDPQLVSDLPPTRAGVRPRSASCDRRLRWTRRGWLLLLRARRPCSEVTASTTFWDETISVLAPNEDSPVLGRPMGRHACTPMLRSRLRCWSIAWNLCS